MSQAEEMSKLCIPSDKHICTYVVGISAGSDCSYFIQVPWVGRTHLNYDDTLERSSRHEKLEAQGSAMGLYATSGQYEV